MCYNTFKCNKYVHVVDICFFLSNSDIESVLYILELSIKGLFCQKKKPSCQPSQRVPECRLCSPACCRLTKPLLISSDGEAHVEFWQLVFLFSTFRTPAAAGILFTLLCPWNTGVADQTGLRYWSRLKYSPSPPPSASISAACRSSFQLLSPSCVPPSRPSTLKIFLSGVKFQLKVYLPPPNSTHT